MVSRNKVIGEHFVPVFGRICCEKQVCTYVVVPQAPNDSNVDFDTTLSLLISIR